MKLKIIIIISVVLIIGVVLILIEKNRTNRDNDIPNEYKYGSYGIALCKAYEYNQIEQCLNLKKNSEDCVFKSKLFRSLQENNVNICDEINTSTLLDMCKAIHNKDTTYCSTNNYWSVNQTTIRICENIVNNSKEWFLKKDPKFIDLFTRENATNNKNLIGAILLEKKPCEYLGII
jgi:hypothetical protein